MQHFNFYAAKIQFFFELTIAILALYEIFLALLLFKYALADAAVGLDTF